MSGSSQEPCRVAYLPDEILFHILEYLPDLPTLFEITTIVDPDALDTPPWGLLGRFVDRYPLQLQKLIRFAMCVRYGKLSHEKDLEEHLVSNLENLQPLPFSTVSGLRNLYRQENLNEKVPTSLNEHQRTAETLPFLILDSIHDPVTIVQDMSIISSDMEQLVRSFICTRLDRTHVRMKDKMTEEYQHRLRLCNGKGHTKAMHEELWGPGHCLKAYPSTMGATQNPPILDRDTEPAPPSPTELHRIRRAVWRLLLYSDLFHEPNPKYPIRNKGNQSSDASYTFLWTLTAWELEEIECVYYHLREQMELWTSPQSSCYSPKLAGRLLNTFGPIRNVYHYPSKQEDCDGAEGKRHITYLTGFLRETLWAPKSYETKTEWPDTQEANRPNAGWLYLEENYKVLNVLDGNFRIAPVCCFLDWGYCIWDRSRLESWYLVDRRGINLLGSKAKSAWWACSQIVRRDCAHCKISI